MAATPFTTTSTTTTTSMNTPTQKSLENVSATTAAINFVTDDNRPRIPPSAAVPLAPSVEESSPTPPADREAQTEMTKMESWPRTPASGLNTPAPPGEKPSHAKLSNPYANSDLKKLSLNSDSAWPRTPPSDIVTPLMLPTDEPLMLPTEKIVTEDFSREQFESEPAWPRPSQAEEMILRDPPREILKKPDLSRPGQAKKLNSASLFCFSELFNLIMIIEVNPNYYIDRTGGNQTTGSEKN